MFSFKKASPRAFPPNDPLPILEKFELIDISKPVEKVIAMAKKFL